MGGPVEVIPSRVRNRDDTHSTRKNLPLRRLVQHYHQFASISKVSKSFTNDVTPTSGPGHVERLQQIFPPPNSDYDSPIQMGTDLPEHWSSDIEINDLWNTRDAFEKI